MPQQPGVCFTASHPRGPASAQSHRSWQRPGVAFTSACRAPSQNGDAAARPPVSRHRAARRAHPALLSGAPAIWPSQPKFLQLCTQVLAQKGALHKRRPVPKRCVCVCCCCFVVRITYIVLHTLERNHRGTRSHACHRAAAARAGQLPFLFSLESLNVARRVEAQWYPPLRVVLLAIIWGLLPSVTAPHQHTPLAAWRNWPQRLVSWDEWRDPLLLHLPRE